MNWLILIIAGLFEVSFAFCLGKAKETNGTEMYLWYLGFLVALSLSMILLIKATETLPIGTAYAVWTGIGAVGTVLIGIFVFNEPTNMFRIFFLSTLIISIIGLKAVSMPNSDSIMKSNGYVKVNGINMYYEIYGDGAPLVLVHGGGSTIQTNFEKIIPSLAKSRKIIAMELQAHGRTSDRNVESSFEQDADDVIELLNHLNIKKADFLGFSNGGTTCIQIAIRNPQYVNKLILGSALAKRSGMPDWFWGMMQTATLEQMPTGLKEGFLKVNPDSNALQKMHDRDAIRMVKFKDISDENLKSIEKPTLIIVGKDDVVSTNHATQLHHLIPKSELAIVPGMHGQYLGEVTTIGTNFKDSDLAIDLIQKFLNTK